LLLCFRGAPSLTVLVEYLFHNLHNNTITILT
jgi:hypothetical protein